MKIDDNREMIKSLEGRIDTLTRSLAAVNNRLAVIDPGTGDIGAIRRKLLEHDLKLATLERGGGLAADLASLPGHPYSD